MNNAEFLELLQKFNSPDRMSCRISDSDSSLAQWWAESRDGPDMAWLLTHLVDARRLALILADVVEPAPASLAEDERRGVEADTLRRWARGDATEQQINAAYHRTVNAAYVAYAHAAAYATCAYTDANAAYSSATNAASLGVDVPSIIRRHVSAKEIVSLARVYMAKNP